MGTIRMSMIRVLVVEDHLIVRDGLASLLDATADMEVVAVASGIRDAAGHLVRRSRSWACRGR